MAHWAEINEQNTVVNVVVGDNNDSNGDEGYQWLIDNLGGRWIKTSFNTLEGKHLLGGTPLRKNYAAIGYTYDETRDAFIAPQPYPSWLLNEETCAWYPPISFPVDEYYYVWNEETVSWDRDGLRKDPPVESE